MFTNKPKVEVHGNMAVVKTAFPYLLASKLREMFSDVSVGQEGVVVTFEDGNKLNEALEEFVLDDEIWWVLETDTPTTAFELTRRDIREFIENLDDDSLRYIKKIVEEEFGRRGL